MEFDNLPANSSVAEVKCTIKCLGTRVSFDTGTTVTGAANNSHVIFGQHVVGLNKKVPMINVKITGSTLKPMVPSKIDYPTLGDRKNRIWGDMNLNVNSTITNFPQIINTVRALPTHAALHETHITSGLGEKQKGFPRLDKLVDVYNHTGMLNETIVNYSYKPQCGILRAQSQHHTLNHQNTFNTGLAPLNQRYMTMQRGNNSDTGTGVRAENSTALFTRSGQHTASIFKYNTTIEKAFNLTSINSTPHMYTPQPQVHVGILTVQSNAPNDAAPEFVNACAY